MTRAGVAAPGAVRAAPGLEALVTGLFDYAGMFPPAALPFEAMLRESAALPRLLRRPHLLGGDLVLELGHLRRLDDAALRAAGFDRTPGVAVVGVDVAEAAQAAADLARRGSDAPRLLSLECVISRTDGLEPRLEAAREALPQGARLFVEPRWSAADWTTKGAALLETLQSLARRGRQKVGLKVRCAGATGVDPAVLARLLGWCAATGLPLKATQGLHHPILEARHGNDHGFLAAAAALRLRQALGDEFGERAMLRCLAASDPAAFSFEDGLAWEGHAADQKTLEASVGALPFAVGSCSLREPDDDLARLFPDRTPG